MFKRKSKKSHKNDEIFIDYSKDIDVKNKDEDEAVPEHYEALKVDDDIVVSPTQIKEAITQKKQDEFIAQKHQEANILQEQETATEEEVIEDEHTDKEQKKEEFSDSSIEEGPVFEYHYVEDTSIKEDGNIEENEPIKLQQNNDDVSKKPASLNTKIEEEKKPETFRKKVEPNEEKRYQQYPSFLQEEMEQRRATKYPKKTTEAETKTEEIPTEKTKKTVLEKTDYNKPLDESDMDKIKENDTEESSTQVNTQDNFVQKQDLSRYFDVDKTVLKKEAKKYRKQKQKQATVTKPVYSYKHHDFEDMGDFLSFIEDHLYQLDDIASDVLKDEHFFRWLKDESSHFEESVVKMKKLKQELKQ